MLHANMKVSEGLSLLATFDPVSQAAATVTTGWVSAAIATVFLAQIQTGVMGASGTIDAKIQQATDSGGTGAKDVAGKAIVQILKAAGDNKQAFINFRDADLDVSNGFAFVRVSVTVGTAASLIAVNLWGSVDRFEDAALFNQAGVVQNV